MIGSIVPVCQLLAPLRHAHASLSYSLGCRHLAYRRVGELGLRGFHWRSLSRAHPRRASQPRRAASIAAMSIFSIPIIASKARFASSPPAASASVSTRGVICQEIPHLSLHHPHWLACPPLPTIAFQ